MKTETSEDIQNEIINQLAGGDKTYRVICDAFPRENRPYVWANLRKLFDEGRIEKYCIQYTREPFYCVNGRKNAKD